MKRSIDDDVATTARRLWEAIEPIHMVVYFANEPAEDARHIGLKGFWMGYFAGRLSPLGPVPAETAAAITYVFAPGMVSRAIPDAWRKADPNEVLNSRVRSAAAALRQHLPADVQSGLALLDDGLWDLVEACSFEGRPLGAGWSSVPRPDDPVEAAWLSATILREHRGDGHVMASVTAGLDGIEAGLTHAATGAVTYEMLERSRGWTTEELTDASRRLIADGLMDGRRGLTSKGRAARRSIEQKTDRLASGPINRAGSGFVRGLIELAAPISRQLFDNGLLPMPNPVGVGQAATTTPRRDSPP